MCNRLVFALALFYTTVEIIYNYDTILEFAGDLKTYAFSCKNDPTIIDRGVRNGVRDKRN